MEATVKFQNILQIIKSSSLNYKIEESPFSATISLKNSYIKDRSGNLLIQSSTSNFEPKASLDNQALIQKNVQLEEVIRKLKSDYEYALDDCEKAQNINSNLENKIELLGTKLAETVKAEKVDTIEIIAFKNKCAELAFKAEALEDDIIQKASNIEQVSAQNRNYRNEIKSINAKHEKVVTELKCLKNENENRQKEINSLSVALKSSRKDLKDNKKVNEEKMKELVEENRKLEEFKTKQIAEAREIKKKQKKLKKTQKKEIRKQEEEKLMEAKINVIEVLHLDQPNNTNGNESRSLNPPQPQPTALSSSFEISTTSNFFSTMVAHMLTTATESSAASPSSSEASTSLSENHSNLTLGDITSSSVTPNQDPMLENFTKCQEEFSKSVAEFKEWSKNFYQN